MLRFVKTHGLGNDFILVEADRTRGRDANALARAICDRRMGIGADGLILWRPEGPQFDLRIINSDGSEAECSGNGLRCVAAYLVSQGLDSDGTVHLRTVSGTYRLDRVGDRFAADMGVPDLEPARIPFRSGTAADNLERIVDYPLDVDGETVRISACATGNPHCSLFVDTFDPDLFASLGPKVEAHPAFPNHTNVEFIRVINRKEIEVRFWERGAGPTPASGTGSCGAAVASILNDRTGRKVTVHAENGDLEVEWGADGRLTLVSTASVVADGQYADGQDEGWST
jgi:diaminopimelate epimerase